MRYLTTLLLSLFSFTLFAQCDADFDFGEAEWGASPDANAGEQFDTAYVDVPYADVFHVLVPTDASAIDPMFTLPLDSVLLVGVTLIDTVTLETFALTDVGLDIICNNLESSPNPCTLIAGDQYCASLEGTPTNGGVYQMTLEVEAWVTVFGVGVAQPYLFAGYILDIVGESSGNSTLEEEAELWSVFPNPADESVMVQGLTSNARIQAFDIAGKELPLPINNFSSSNVSISTRGWSNGLYFLVVSTDSGVNTRRILIRH